jgi:hypothetical protein
LNQYRQRVNALDYPPELIRLYLGEGDSLDETWRELMDWAIEDSRIIAIKRDTHRPRLWHTPRPERMKTLAITGNAVWNRIATDGWGEVALMLESDLLYMPDLLRSLIERIPEDAAALAPMIWTPVEEQLRFYDVWAFRSQDGQMFGPYPPAWFAKEYGEAPFEIYSAGSAILFKVDYIRGGARLSEETAIVGMCEQVRAMGGKLYCDPAVHIIHPIVRGVK